MNIQDRRATVYIQPATRVQGCKRSRNIDPSPTLFSLRFSYATEKRAVYTTNLRAEVEAGLSTQVSHVYHLTNFIN